MAGAEQDEGDAGRAQAVREIHGMAFFGWIDCVCGCVADESVAQELRQ
jgi:hypothetical protein